MATYQDSEPSADSSAGDLPAEAKTDTPAVVKPTRRRKPQLDGAAHLYEAFKFGALLAEQIRGRYRFAKGLGWMNYSGAQWEPCAEEQLIPEIRDMLAQYAQSASVDGMKDLAKASSNSGISGTLRVARGLEGIFTRDEDFDAPRDPQYPGRPHLWPCSNGITIELYDSGVWRARDSHPDDLLTRVGCAYDPDAKASLVAEQFKNYQPNDEIRQFMLRTLAGTLRGVQIQNLFVWFGEKAGNGKGTMQAVFSEVFGGYAQTIPVQALMKTSNSNEYRDELVSLKGARLVFADEPEEGSRFAAGHVSRLTGGSPIKARGMYRSAVEFVPTWTLIMPTNKRPAWGNHAGLARRYSETAWDFVIPRDKMSEGVKDRMRAEASGVLNQLLRHWENFCEMGIAPPEVVVEQTKEGREASDPIARFLSDCTKPTAGTKTRAKLMYDAYKAWADEENEHAKSGRVFGESLLEKGLERLEDSMGRYYLDVALVEHL